VRQAGNVEKKAPDSKHSSNGGRTTIYSLIGIAIMALALVFFFKRNRDIAQAKSHLEIRTVICAIIWREMIGGF
jgi:LPXTG-motif cell wall-anchored protein